MERSNYHLCYSEALVKASSARAADVRNAYLDLADFYRRKLEESRSSYQTPEDLGHCFGEQILAA